MPTVPQSHDRPATLDERSLQLRRDILWMLSAVRRGHIGSAFSTLEILRVLYDEVLRIDPTRPDWNERDRFVLSKGHGCLGLYAVLADKGFFPREELLRACSFDGILGGHPDYDKVPGVEASTGSLGHGLAIGVGIAIGARLDGRDSRVFVLVGDGECDEGSIWEAAMIAAKHRLDRLTVFVDYNKMQSYGPTTDVVDLEPFADKWRSFGFAAREVDGHDVQALRETMSALPFEAGRPSAIICHTVKGKGIPYIEGDPAWHHKSRLSDGDLTRLQAALEGEQA